MTDSKKILKKIALVLLLILLGIEVCMEMRYSCDEAVVTSENTEAILRRVPEVEITEGDRDLVEAFSRCAAVRKLLESGESGDLSPGADGGGGIAVFPGERGGCRGECDFL